MPRNRDGRDNGRGEPDGPPRNKQTTLPPENTTAPPETTGPPLTTTQGPSTTVPPPPTPAPTTTIIGDPPPTTTGAPTTTSDPSQTTMPPVTTMPPWGGDTGVDVGGGNVPGAGAGPGSYGSSGTGNDPTASEWDVTREQTVAGQLEDAYDRGSPFMDKAAAETERKHQAGGGQNSLMARKAGQLAAMDTAFKIAFADAATYARSAEFNAAMKNQFGLAEQRFIQNSLLSEQNYNQSVELQTQMIAGQLEGIRQEYRGRGMLMDKEQFHAFQMLDAETQAARLLAGDQHGYNMAVIAEEFANFFDKAMYESQLKEFAEQSGYQRQVHIQGIISQGNFLSQGFDSVMQYANNPNFTPEQAAAAARSGMQWLEDTYDINQAYWDSVYNGTEGGDLPTSPYGGGYPWWDYDDDPTTTGPNGNQGPSENP